MLSWTTILVSVLAIFVIGCKARMTAEDAEQAKLYGMTSVEYYDRVILGGAKLDTSLDDDFENLRSVMIDLAKTTGAEFGDFFDQRYVKYIDDQINILRSKKSPVLYQWAKVTSKKVVELITYAIGNGFMNNIVSSEFRTAYNKNLKAPLARDGGLQLMKNTIHEALTKLNTYNAYYLQRTDPVAENPLQKTIDGLLKCRSLAELKAKAQSVYKQCMLSKITQLNTRVQNVIYKAIHTVVGNQNEEEFDKLKNRILNKDFVKPDHIVNGAMEWTDGFEPLDEFDDEEDLPLRSLFANEVYLTPITGNQHGTKMESLRYEDMVKISDILVGAAIQLAGNCQANQKAFSDDMQNIALLDCTTVAGKKAYFSKAKDFFQVRVVNQKNLELSQRFAEAEAKVHLKIPSEEDKFDVEKTKHLMTYALPAIAQHNLVTGGARINTRKIKDEIRDICSEQNTLNDLIDSGEYVLQKIYRTRSKQLANGITNVIDQTVKGKARPEERERLKKVIHENISLIPQLGSNGDFATSVIKMLGFTERSA